ncbi:hypothetical protein CPB84DRAFT_1857726 [Gymnopilus junonius]|uniref:Uncharacterized protein n=1 Tax=Gymnopilus junonius TaxID=109634 RepID=A0A9P5N742_GYMJU|nr:hypothetical protein CPB84DRAFT_1857726 [Gymnopilus junonius]
MAASKSSQANNKPAGKGVGHARSVISGPPAFQVDELGTIKHAKSASEGPAVSDRRKAEVTHKKSTEPDADVDSKLRLRASNRDAHPGLPDVKRAKRSSEEVAVECEEKQRRIEDAKERREQALTKAAELEDKMHNQRPKDGPASKPASNDEQSGLSDNEYKQPTNGDETSSDEEVLDNSDDDEKTHMTKPKKKQKQKGEVRKAVAAQRKMKEGNKKRGNEDNNQHAPAKKAKKNDEGLVPGWDKQSSHDDFDNNNNIRSTDKRAPPASSKAADDDDNEPLGGLSDDAGELGERKGLVEDAKGAAAHQSLTVVSATMTVPEYIAPEKIKNKQEICYRHLPEPLRQLFQDDLIPLLIQLYGIEHPWSVNLPDTRIIDLFVKIFPGAAAYAGSPNGQKIIVKLADDALTTWRNKIGQTTINYMENVLISEFAQLTPEYIRAWVKWALSGDFKSRPLYYRTYVDEDPEANQPAVKLNIFCHPLIISAMAYHVGRISAIPEFLRSAKLPSGALIMAVQSAYRAVARWSSGSYVQPPCPLLDFSGDNWGDSDKRDPSDAPRNLPPYSIQGKKPTREIERVIEKLNDKQWEEIMSAAREMAAGKGKKRLRSSSGDDASSEAAADVKDEDKESDFEVEDDAGDAMDTAEDVKEE